MNRTSLLTVLGIGTAGVVISVVAAIVLLGGGDEESETRSTCGGAPVELSVERDDDDNRMQASLEIKADAAGQPWDVRITTNGREVLDRTVTSDDEAEVEVGAFLGTGEQSQRVTATLQQQGGTRCQLTAALG